MIWFWVGDHTEIARVAFGDLVNGPACQSSKDLCIFVEELNSAKRMVASTVYANALDSYEAIDNSMVRLPVNFHIVPSGFGFNYPGNKNLTWYELG